MTGPLLPSSISTRTSYSRDDRPWALAMAVALRSESEGALIEAASCSASFRDGVNPVRVVSGIRALTSMSTVKIAMVTMLPPRAMQGSRIL